MRCSEPGMASWLQANALVGRVAEFWSLGALSHEQPNTTSTDVFREPVYTGIAQSCARRLFWALHLFHRDLASCHHGRQDWQVCRRGRFIYFHHPLRGRHYCHGRWARSDAAIDHPDRRKGRSIGSRVDGGHNSLPSFLLLDVFMNSEAPKKSPEPTAVGAVSFAVAGHVAGRQWLFSLGGDCIV